MIKQNYKNHIRYYIPHHFVFLPMMSIFLILGIRNIFSDETHRLEWEIFSIISFCILYLAIMLRQHYALGNQDRIVRLEFRLRYFEFFKKNTTEIEKQLSFSQIAALRFTDDQQFEELLNRTIKENLSADEIKKSISNWKGDYMRL